MSIKSIVVLAIGIILIATLTVPYCFPQTNEETLDVVVVDGQSNAQYWGWNTNNICSATIVNESGLEAPEHNLYYYGDSTPTFYGPVYTQPTYDTTLASYDLHLMYENDAWTIGGYGPTMAKMISERSGHDVLVIDVGVGAAPIQWLTSTGPGGIWAVKIIQDALDKVPSGYSVDMLGMVWAQGESDSLTNVDTYIGYFDNLYEKFNTEFGLEKVYIIKTRDAYGGNSITAQEQLAEDNDNITIATSITDDFTIDNGLLVSDGLHYSQAGRTAIAEVLGEVIEYNDHSENESLELLKVIPIILVVALVVGAIGFVVVKRD